MFAQSLLLVVMLVSTAAFHMQSRIISQTSMKKTHKSSSTQQKMLPDLRIAAAQAVDDPNYVYGAVSAPDWVLPVGAFGIIITAAIPALLAPAENELEAQRQREEETKSGFGKGLNSGKKRSDRI